MKRFTLLLLAALFGLPMAAFSQYGSQGQHYLYSGDRRIAVIMLAWQDKACPATRQTVVNRVWNDNQSIRKYFLDMSRGLLDYAPPADADANGVVPASTSAVYGPYTLSTAEGYHKDITYNTLVENGLTEAGSRYMDGSHAIARDLATQRDGFNSQNYDYIIYITPKGPSTGSTGGYAGVQDNYQHIYVAKQNYINHEMGHSLGLAHSNTTVDRDGYGSQDCIMGNQNNPHLDAVHTYNMGWYPDDVFSIQSYGQHTIENLAQPGTDNVKVVRFDRSAHDATTRPNYDLWVSYRVRGIGQDSGLNSNWDRKVNIHYCLGASLRPSDPVADQNYYNWWGWVYYYSNNNVTKFLPGGNYTDPDDGLCKVRFLREDNSGNQSAVVQFINPNGNQPPSIPDQSVGVTIGNSNFTIETNDPENDTLSYTILAQPAQGTLDVAGDTFTYNGSTAGNYSFTVRVNDGQFDSFDVTIPLQVVGLNPPTANAGADQTLTLSDGTPTLWTPADLIPKPVAWYDADDASTITASNGLVSQWADKSGNGNTLSASGNPMTGTRSINGKNVIDFDGSGDQLLDSTFSSISTENISIFAVQKHDSNSVQSMTAWALERTTSSQGLLFHSSYNTSFSLGQRSPENKSVGYTENTNIELISYVKSGSTSQQAWVDGAFKGTQSSPVTTFMTQQLALGSRSGANYLDGAIGEFIVVSGPLSSDDRQRFEGYLAHKWGRTLPNGHPYENVAPTNGTGAVAILEGSVDDLDGTTPNATWSVVSTQPSDLPVVFGNASSPNTTALLLQAGTYTLRLTADDGFYTASDDVIITVNEPTTTGYEAWVGSYDLGGLTDMTDNPDGDRRSNMMEFAFGTDPTLRDSGSLATDGSRHGDPVAEKLGGGGMVFCFIRRKDYLTSGITYTVCFSSNLAGFHDNDDNANPPSETITSSADAAYEVVKVPYPATLPNGQAARFGCVRIEETAP